MLRWQHYLNQFLPGDALSGEMQRQHLTHFVPVQLMQFDSAEADCDKALKLELSVKTLLRRGTARRGQQDVEGARRDFKHALGLEPNNRCVLLLACLPL